MRKEIVRKAVSGKPRSEILLVSANEVIIRKNHFQEKSSEISASFINCLCCTEGNSERFLIRILLLNGFI